MERLLSLIAKPLAALAIAASVFAPVMALADTPRYNDTTDNRNSIAAGETVPSSNLSNYATGNTNGSTGTDLQCSASTGMGLAICVSGFVYYITVGLGSWIAGITAYVFDYAVQLSLVSGAYAFDFINIGWGIVRDVANMSFLFILIYIAFKIMFQAETSGTMRMLVWVVVVALLVNFSFLMTRVVIDAGNIVALQFYNAIAPPGTATIQNPGGQTSNNSTTGGTGTADITASIMNALNPQGIIGTDGFKNVVSNQGNSAMYYLIVSSIVYILTGVSLFMLAAVFIFAALRFIMRIIGLWFVIIAAPVAFVAAIFNKEGGRKWFNKWLGYLLEFSFYPAVFLFMFYIEVRFLQEMNNTALFNDLYNATANASAAGSQSWAMIAQAAASVSVRLGFIMATMYLILRSSQWMGGAFKDIGIKWAEGGLANLGRGTLRGAIGTTAFIGRNSLGATGRIRGNALLANGTYDIRNAPLVRTLVGSSLGKPTPANRAYGLATRDTPEGRKKAEEARSKADKAASEERKRQATVDAKHAAEREANQQREQERQAAVDEKHANEREVRATEQGRVNALFRAVRRETAQPDDITAVKSGSIPTGARRLPGGAPITAVAGGSTGVPASTPFNVSAQRALDEIKQKAQQTARAATVAINLTTTPDLSKSSTARNNTEIAPAPTVRDGSDIKQEIHTLGQSVREAISAAKNGTPMAPKITVSVPEHAGSTPAVHTASAHIGEEDINKIAKKLSHKLEPILSSHTPEPTPPSPTAPAAARPAPQAHNDDYPYSQAAE